MDSIGGFQGSQKFDGLSVYALSKAAHASITERLAKEYREAGIAFNCLALGETCREMVQQAFPGYKASIDAVDMARFTVDFATNGQRYPNGKVLPVTTTNP